MIARILLLALLLGGLVYFETQLADARSSERSTSSQLRPLMSQAERDGMLVAGVRVQTAEGESFLYARTRGVWRLIEPPVNTYTQPGAVEQLMSTIVEASGVVLTNEKHRAKSYGFGGELALRISFHGTKLKTDEDGDVLYTIDVGYPIPGTEGSYVRPLGTNEVWSIDHNPRSLLSRPPGSNFPPMLDPHLIPATSAAEKGGLVGIMIESKVTENFEVRLVGTRQDEELPGAVITSWELTREDGTVLPCDEIPARGYALYLSLAPYSKILGAESIDPEVIEDPDVRVTLTPSRGEPFALHFGRPKAGGARDVANFDTKTMFEVSPEVAKLLLPTAEMVAEESKGNPWHDFIQVNPIAGRNLLENPIIPR